jgi:hypothetical protein
MTIAPVAEHSGLGALFHRVFANTDPFGYPFTSAVDAVLVFYPIEGYWLTRPQYDSVVNAARALGDSTFYLSLVEHSGDWVARGEHWLCKFPRYEEYRGIESLVLENALYSSSGRWGVLISHESHALVGGSREFVHHVMTGYPTWQQDWGQLVQAWAANPNGGWVNQLSNRITTA